LKLLLDTHILLWAAADSERLSAAARRLIGDVDNERFFSAASLWELAAKRGLGREDFQVDVLDLRDGLLDNSYQELPVRSAHAISTTSLPPIHKDPFDRILVAQAIAEGMILLTADPSVAQYFGPVRKV
jgi:PIN domain nuclease of toxin-antitoxin system